MNKNAAHSPLPGAPNGFHFQDLTRLSRCAELIRQIVHCCAIIAGQFQDRPYVTRQCGQDGPCGRVNGALQGFILLPCDGTGSHLAPVLQIRALRIARPESRSCVIIRGEGPAVHSQGYPPLVRPRWPILGLGAEVRHTDKYAIHLNRHAAHCDGLFAVGNIYCRGHVYCLS